MTNCNQPHSRPKSNQVAETDNRGQLALSTFEVTIGVVLILAVVSLSTVALSDATGVDPQLEAYATDSLTVLVTTAGEDTGVTGTAGCRPAGCAKHLDQALPDNVLYHVETEAGTAGYDPPAKGPTATATQTTSNGKITVTVWYP